jgi:hypothetical protein
VSDGWSPPPWESPPQLPREPIRARWRTWLPVVVALTVVVLVYGTAFTVVAITSQTGPEEKDASPAISDREREMVDAIGADPQADEATHQLTMTFDRDVSPETLATVEREWRANPQLHLVLVMSADEVADATGFSTPAIAAWATEEDLAEVEAFACGYLDQPGVALVGLDDTPCEPPPAPTPTPPSPSPGLANNSVTLTFHTDQPEADVDAVREEFERSGLFAEVSISPAHGPATTDRLYANGTDPAAICRFVRPYADHEAIINITAFVPGCYDL